MDVKKSLISLALCATTSLMTFGSNSKEFINYSEKSTQAILSSAEQRNYSQIDKIVLKMLDSTNRFYKNVVLVSNKFIYNWSRENSEEVGKYLANLVLQIDEIKVFFKNLYKRHKDFSLNKKTKQNIKDMMALLDSMRKQIQFYIDLTYKGIDAKHSFIALKKIVEIERIKISIDDYWYSDEIDNNTLFISTKDSIEEPGKIFEIEDRLTDSLKLLSTKKKEMPQIEFTKIAGFDFNAINKQHFDRVSLV